MKKILHLALFTFMLISSVQPTQSEEKITGVYPSALLALDDYFSHHVLIAEKSTHQLHLYRNNKGYPTLVKSYKMATGKKAGDKRLQGDYRTPEGIFLLTQFLTHDDLIARHGKAGEIYGVGAFVMNYPNLMDRRQGKGGNGIWLHSTNDETRIEKGLDSRGCIVTSNKNLIEISKYIELNYTSLIVVEDLDYFSETTWKTKREKITSTIQEWVTAWKKENFKKYISFYHPQQFADNSKGNYFKFKKYKKAVFNNPGAPDISIKNLSIFLARDYALATFKQFYKSKTIDDVGQKTLFLVKDQYYRWVIVSETWRKIPLINTNERQVAFRPSLRFFKSEEVNKMKKH